MLLARANQADQANLQNKDDWGHGWHVGENGERAQSVRVTCTGDWQY